MSEKDELFILIHSMDMNEKGYFKKFAGINGQKENSIYLRLFDCIGRMEAYELSAINDEFKGEKVLRHLTVTKFYLKGMIIRALRNYHEEREPTLRNTLALGDIHIMLKKGLLQSAKKKIQKEKEAAMESENFLMTLQWMWYSDQWLHDARMIGEMASTGQSVLEEKKHITEQWLDIEGYTYLKGQVAAATIINGKHQVKLINQLLRHPLLKPGKAILSNKGRYSSTELRARMYLMTDEPEKGIMVLTEMIAWCDNPANTYMPPPVHYFILHNLLLHFMGREQADNMAYVIMKCRKIASSNDESISLHHYHIMQTYLFIHEIRMYLYQGRHDEALKVGLRLEHYIKKNGGNDSDKVTLWLLLAIAYKGTGQLDKSLDRLNRIFVAEHKSRNDLLIDAYLLNIILHIELGNHSIIERQITIAKNFIKSTFPGSNSALNLANMVGLAARAIVKGNDLALLQLAPRIVDAVDKEKIRRKEFIKEWISDRLNKSIRTKESKAGEAPQKNIAARGISG